MSANLATREIISRAHPVLKEAQHYVLAFLEASSAYDITGSDRTIDLSSIDNRSSPKRQIPRPIDNHYTY